MGAGREAAQRAGSSPPGGNGTADAIAVLEDDLASVVEAALPLCERHSREIAAEGGTVDPEDGARREETARAFLQVAGTGELVLRRRSRA